MMNRLGTPLISVVIIAVLSLQTFAVIRKTRQLWPFVDYAMYKTKHEAGDRVEVRDFVFATLSDLSEIQIQPGDLGLSFFKFRWQFVYPILNDQREKVELLVNEYEQRYGKKIVSIRVEDYPLIVTREGGKAVPPQILKTFVLESRAKK